MVAYDPDDHAVWVANDGGFAWHETPKFGVAEYTPQGEAQQTFRYDAQFVAPGEHEEPYSITVCPRAATRGRTVVVVGFIDDLSGQGRGVLQAFATDGAALGAPFWGGLVLPYGLSCGADGTVYIADKSGLYRGRVTAGGFGLGSFAASAPGLTPPVYGVLVDPTPLRRAPSPPSAGSPCRRDTARRGPPRWIPRGCRRGGLSTRSPAVEYGERPCR